MAYELLEAEPAGYEVLEPEQVDLLGEESRRIPGIQATTQGAPQRRQPGPGAFGGIAAQIQQEPLPSFSESLRPILPSHIGPEESLLAISPAGVATGAEITEATGIPKAVTIPVSGAGKAVAGLGQFLTSPAGIAQSATAMIPGVGILQRAKWIYDMAKGTGETAGSLYDRIAKIATSPDKTTTEEWQGLAEDAANTALMLYGAGKLTSHEVSALTGIRAPLGRVIEPEKTRLSKDLAREIEQAPVVAETIPTAQPIVVPDPRGEPIPGIAENAALMDAALREAQQRIVQPGQVPAIDLLRRQREDQIVPAGTAEPLAFEGGGEAPFGQVSYMRKAEAPLTERTQQALEREKQNASEITKATGVPELEVRAQLGEEAPLRQSGETAIGTGRSAEGEGIPQQQPQAEVVPTASKYTHESGWTAIVSKDPAAGQPGDFGTTKKPWRVSYFDSSGEARGHRGFETAAEAEAGVGAIEGVEGSKIPRGGWEQTKTTTETGNAPVVFDSMFGPMPMFRATSEFKMPGLEGPPQKVGSKVTLAALQKSGLKVPESELAKSKLPSDPSAQMEPSANPKTAPPPKETAPVQKQTAAAGEKMIAPDKIEQWFDDAIKKTQFGTDWTSRTSMGVSQIPVWLAQEAATLALRATKLAYVGTRDLGRAISAGLDELRKHNGFNEGEARAWLAGELSKASGGELKSSLDIINERLASATAGGATKIRKSAERATTSEMVPAPVQKQIKAAPESQYQVQSMKKVEDVVNSMSETDLANVPKESNLYTAAALERSRRLFDAGKHDEGYQVFVELEKEGTRLGQLINQFKMLKGSTPESVVSAINTTLVKNGRDPLTEVQSGKALQLSKDSKAKDAELDRATAAWKKDPSDSNAKAAEDALIAANKSGLELQRFIGKFQPKTISGTLKSVLQGNLLTPISQTANIVGNMSFLPFRAATRGIASALDILDNRITGRQRSLSVGGVGGTKQAAKGLVEGLAKAPEIMVRGQGDVIKGESRQGMHPVRAWINQFSKTPESPTVKGRLTLKDRIGLAIEGTFGVPAEMMLRGLGAGDAPFKEAAHARVIAEQLRLNNVPKNQWSFARKFPELFFDSKTMDQIHKDTMAAVFQRESSTLNLFTKWIHGKGDLFDLAVATVAPYKLTPWNIIGEIMSYNPVVAFGRTAYEAKNKNFRAAKINAGKFVVGSMLTGAGWWLYKNGLLAPSMDERDESQKARLLANEIIPPNHINLSGLKRKLAGGSPDFKPGDETVDIFRAGGLAGGIFYMTANIGRKFEKMPEQPGSEIWQSIITQSTLEQARFGLSQSFLSGVEGLLSAVKDGNADNYVRQWMGTVAALPMPNSLSALGRSTREFKPEFREDEFRKRAANVVKSRLGMTGDLPVKRDLWGRPLKETPEGRNAIIYQFFDITKNKQVSSDPVSIELYRLWRRTGNTMVIPSIPDRELTVGGTTYLLDSSQQTRLAELVGKSRRDIAESIVTNPEFHKVPDEAKISILKKAYDTGRNVGVAALWKEVTGNLKIKPKRAAFE